MALDGAAPAAKLLAQRERRSSVVRELRQSALLYGREERR